MTQTKILMALLLLSAVLLLSHRTRAISAQGLVRDPGAGAEGVVADQGNYSCRIRGTDQVIDRMEVVN